MSVSKRYFYQGYECLATYQEKTGQWLCVVENVTYPFVFEASEERFIQGNFEHDIKSYIERCSDKAIAPKKESVLNSAQRVIADGIRKQRKESARQEKKRAREFNSSYWKYLLALPLAVVPAMGYLMLATLGRTIPFAMFFPYHANVETKRFPILTVAVCLICMLVYIAQEFSDNRFEKDCASFAQKQEVSDYSTLMKQMNIEPIDACDYLAYVSYLKYPEQYLTNSVADIIKLDEHQQNLVDKNPHRLEEINNIVLNAYREQVKTVTPGLIERLAFHSNQFDVIGTYTAKFVHDGWDHILFNLIFFFAFAACVELLAGPVVFLLMFAVIPPFIAIFYSDSFVIAGNIHGNGSLGLSGMCAAFMACLLVLKPKLEIKTFFWFIFVVRTYNVPVWFLAAWYVSSDLSALLNGVDDGVGHIAHFVGACVGALIGLACKVMQKKMDHEAIIERATT